MYVDDFLNKSYLFKKLNWLLTFDLLLRIYERLRNRRFYIDINIDFKNKILTSFDIMIKNILLFFNLYEKN